MSESTITDPYEWQKARQRDGFRQEFPIKGFCPNGSHTLWAPTPSIESRWAFQDGKPVQVNSSDCLAKPEIRAARDRVIRSLSAVGVDRIQVGTCIYEYAAAILAENYTLSDDDLTFLLTTGTKWIRDVVHHVCGGEDFVARLAALTPDTILSMVGAIAPAPQPPAPPAPLPGWKRTAAKLLGLN